MPIDGYHDRKAIGLIDKSVVGKVIMTREEQKLNRELKKRLPQEIRKLNKKYKFQYAHEFLYRFEGDFLYIGMPHMSSIECGRLSNSVEIKPWVLDEIYWRVQQMNVEELLRQPKSFHVRGAFTVRHIYYDKLSIYQVTSDNFAEMIENMLIDFDKFISEHKKNLINIECIKDNLDGYEISDLTKALVYINQEEYEEALFLLQNGDKNDGIIHMDARGKTAKEYAIDFCVDAMKNR